MSVIPTELIPPIFRYNDIEVPEGSHKIGPSQISKFFNYPTSYYLENLAKVQDNTFQGNSATTLGTICHYIYNQVILGNATSEKTIAELKKTIDEQLDKYAQLRIEYGIDTPERGLDVHDIKTNYPQISEVVINNYILQSKASKIESEKQVLVNIDDGVYLGGTADLIEDDMIVDFKTVGKKPDEETIPWNYEIQLLAYAHAFRLSGYEINRIRLVYGVKPTKTLPARCFVITKQIDYNADKMIHNTLRLITESVIICRNQPELIHLLFKSIDLIKVPQ